MRIIYVTSESFMDHSFTIAAELKKHIRISTYIIAKKFTEEINEFCKVLDATYVRRSRFRNPMSLLRELILLNSLRRQKYDLVWFDALTVYQALLVKFFIKRFLVNVHDAELHPEQKNVHGAFARWLTFKLHRESVCLAGKTQASIFEDRFCIKPKIFQLPIIDYYQAFHTESSSSESKSPDVLVSNDNTTRFFFFGTILPYKGIEVLLDASEILEKSENNFRLNIYGKITYNEREITGRVEKLRHVQLYNEFISYREVYSIFCQNDMIILPYRHVTQCGPLLIGYNQNIPAICTDLPGFREYVDDGKSGLLFAGTAEDLAAKMKVVIDNPALIKDMRQYIIEQTKPRFSMKALAPVYVENFQ